MKEKELREVCQCSKCEQAVGATGVPLFYRATLTTYALNLVALQRQQGLGMIVGASIASVLGPDEDLATEFAAEDISLCQNCAVELQGFFEQCRKGD